MSLSYWGTGAAGFGHIGIGVNSDATQGYSTADPGVRWYRRLFGAPAGCMEDDRTAHTIDGEVAPHCYLRIPISEEQATAMAGEMADRISRPGRYNLIFNNCDAFVEGVLVAGGLSVVTSPRSIWDDRLWRKAITRVARALCAVVKRILAKERGLLDTAQSPWMVIEPPETDGTTAG